MITLRHCTGGCGGGASRITNGSGVQGLGGCWRMTSGGAGAVGRFGSCLMIISPGAGGVGGFKYLTANSWTYSKLSLYFLVINSGLGSSFNSYWLIGISPTQLATSARLVHIPLVNWVDCTFILFIHFNDKYFLFKLTSHAKYCDFFGFQAT